MSIHEKDPDLLASLTKDLAEVVAEVCEQIKVLKDERTGATGELKDAYDLVIKNKVWILQTFVDVFCEQTKKLDLDKKVEVEKPATKDFCGGPTGCTVEVIELGGENGTVGI